MSAAVSIFREHEPGGKSHDQKAHGKRGGSVKQGGGQRKKLTLVKSRWDRIARNPAGNEQSRQFNEWLQNFLTYGGLRVLGDTQPGAMQAALDRVVAERGEVQALQKLVAHIDDENEGEHRGFVDGFIAYFKDEKTGKLYGHLAVENLFVDPDLQGGAYVRDFFRALKNEVPNLRYVSGVTPLGRAPGDRGVWNVGESKRGLHRVFVEITPNGRLVNVRRENTRGNTIKQGDVYDEVARLFRTKRRESDMSMQSRLRLREHGSHNQKDHGRRNGSASVNQGDEPGVLHVGPRMDLTAERFGQITRRGNWEREIVRGRSMADVLQNPKSWGEAREAVKRVMTLIDHGKVDEGEAKQLLILMRRVGRLSEWRKARRRAEKSGAELAHAEKRLLRDPNKQGYWRRQKEYRRAVASTQRPGVTFDHEKRIKEMFNMDARSLAKDTMEKMGWTSQALLEADTMKGKFARRLREAGVSNEHARILAPEMERRGYDPTKNPEALVKRLAFEMGVTRTRMREHGSHDQSTHGRRGAGKGAAPKKTKGVGKTFRSIEKARDQGRISGTEFKARTGVPYSLQQGDDEEPLIPLRPLEKRARQYLKYAFDYNTGKFKRGVTMGSGVPFRGDRRLKAEIEKQVELARADLRASARLRALRR